MQPYGEKSQRNGDYEKEHTYAYVHEQVQAHTRARAACGSYIPDRWTVESEWQSSIIAASAKL